MQGTLGVIRPIEEASEAGREMRLR
jgi:hypothetical protein